MKKIVFISGKGGTGKSTLVASLSRLVNDKMLADCDVDAPNLHILLNEKIIEKNDYYGASEAVIDRDKCMQCGLCRETCRFGAISGNYEIIPFKCEGCGACTLVCPVDAITLDEVITGNTLVSETDKGIIDVDRVLAVSMHFGIPGFVCINKYDLNPEITKEIENFCQENGFSLIGKIPFEPKIMYALREFKTPVEAGLENIVTEINNIWTILSERVGKGKNKV